MPDKDNKKETAKINYHTKERDLIIKLAQKYKCSPFTGECYTQEAPLYKFGKTYHIIITEEQMKEFGEDYILEEQPSISSPHRVLIMIKPTLEDNNYIFFRRK